MSSVIADLRYAARELRRRPGFALTAILSLALGIGATSAVFSVVYGVLINPFPYVGADRMMQLALRDNAGRFRYPGMTRRPGRAASTGTDRRERRRRRMDGTSRPPMAISPKMSSRRTSLRTRRIIGVFPPSWDDGSSRLTRLRVRTRRASWCSATSSGSGITRATRPWSAARSSSFARTIKSSA